MFFRIILIYKYSIFPIIVLLYLYYLFFYDPYYKGAVSFNHGRILVTAHGSKGFNAPEETINATKEAFQAGVEIVDLDAQLSLDNQLIIFHDFTLDKKTKSSGLVTKKTSAELKKIKIISKTKEVGNISTLDDFLKEFNGSENYFSIELKIPGIRQTGAEDEINKILEKYNAYNRVQINTYNPFVLYRLKKTNPAILTMFVFADSDYKKLHLYTYPNKDQKISTIILDTAWYLRFQKANFIRRFIIKITKPDVLAIQHQTEIKTITTQINKGWPVVLWVVNNEDEMEKAITLQPYAIATDKPKVLREKINETAQMQYRLKKD